MSRAGSVPRVLVADADAGTLAQARLALGGGSYEVVQAADTAEAIAHVASAPPDLLVLDVGLPGAGGLRLARSLKAQPETRDVIVLLLFDKMVPVDRAAGTAAGADGFLAKPFTTLGLLKKVDALLGAGS